MSEKEFVYTGERMIPEYESEEWNREVHYTRYRYAAQSVRSDSDVLDLGCGVGYGTQLLAALTSGRVVGVDKEEAIEYALKHYSADNISYQVADLNVPCNYGLFDIVVSFDVIEHLSNVDVHLQTIQKQLRDGDSLAFISTPHSMKASNLSPANQFHVREYTLREFYELLDRYFYVDDLLMNMGMVAVLRRKGTRQNLLQRDIPIGAPYFCSIEDELNRQYERVSTLEAEIASYRRNNARPADQTVRPLPSPAIEARNIPQPTIPTPWWRLPIRAWQIWRDHGIRYLLYWTGVYLQWVFHSERRRV